MLEKTSKVIGIMIQLCCLIFIIELGIITKRLGEVGIKFIESDLRQCAENNDSIE